jgi:D-sedoheptulose 7-phosphate isomerase
MKEKIQTELKEHIEAIQELEGRTEELETIVELLVACYNNRGKVVLFGNGGSAADAQHIAAELVGKFKIDRKSLPAVALPTNPSVVTAIANDFNFDAVFARQVETFVDDRDVAVGLSTSGNSKNVVNGLRKAKEQGAVTIAFVGRHGGAAKDIADVVFQVSSENTQRIQEVHITAGHIICGLVEEQLFLKK